MIKTFAATIAFFSYPLEKLTRRVIHPFAIRSILLSWPPFVAAAFLTVFLGMADLAYFLADVHKCFIVVVTVLGALATLRK